MVSWHTHQLLANLQQAFERQGTRLALLVSVDVMRLEQFGHTLESVSGWERAALGPALSVWLLEQNKTVTSRLLRQGLWTCIETSKAPLICTEIDLMFDPSFQVDPLALFDQMSRHRPLVVLWPGEVQNGSLTYAQPAHAHYRVWNIPAASEIRLFAL